MAQYRYVGRNPDVLDGGRPVGPGDLIELTDDEVRLPHNESIAAAGHLIGVDSDAEHQQKLASTRLSRREKSTDKTEEDS